MRRVLVLIAAAGLVALLLWMQQDDPARSERATHEPNTSSATDGNDAEVSGASEADRAPSPGSLPIDDDPLRIPGRDVVLTGRVERNGQPVPGAAVDARRHRDPTVIAATTTDASGCFRIEIARRTRVDLLARDDDGRSARAFVLIPRESDPEPVVIRLEDGHAFGGIVLNPDGSPHAGAIVRMFTDPKSYARTAETDSDGRFAFAHVKPGSFTIYISAAGYPTIERSANVPELSELKATLFAGGSVRGTLRDDLERPIGGATITLTSGDERKSPSGPTTAVTNRDGSFVMPCVMPGPCRRATIVHPEWGRRDSWINDIALPIRPVVAGEELTWDITLPTGSTILVRAVAAESGEPLAGARIVMTQMRERELGIYNPRTGIADDSGCVSFLHAPDDGYVVDVDAPGRGNGGYVRRQPIWPLGRERFEVLLKCALAGVVEGRVKTDREVGPEDRGVRLRHARNSYLWSEVDHGGCFRFAAVPACKDAVVVDPDARAKSRSFEVVAGERIWVDVELPDQPAVSGIVVDGNGKPVEGAKVRIVRTRDVPAALQRNDPRRWEWVPVTDKSGEFAIDRPELADRDAPEGKTGDWSIVVLHPDYRPARKDGLDKPNQATPQSVSIELDPGQSIAGSVHFAGGPPAANIPVEATREGSDAKQIPMPRRAMTDAAGKFTLRGLEDGLWALNAIHGEGRSLPISTKAGSDDVRLTIEMHPPITGVLLDDENRPIGGALVSIDRGRSPDIQARTEPSGRFRLEHVPAGSHRLRVRPNQRIAADGTVGSPHFESFESAPIDAGTADVVVRATRGTVLSGRVLDADGQAVPRATIVAELNRSTWVAVANANGVFSIKGAGDDPVRVLATADGYTIRVLELVPDAGIAELRLPPGGSIRGRVLDEVGRPVEGAAVRIDGEDGTLRDDTRWISDSISSALRLKARRFAITSADGEFHFPMVEAGAYELKAEGKDGLSAGARVQTDGPSVELGLTR